VKKKKKTYKTLMTRKKWKHVIGLVGPRCLQSMGASMKISPRLVLPDRTPTFSVKDIRYLDEQFICMDGK
jgi:hypothetical protein